MLYSQLKACSSEVAAVIEGLIAQAESAHPAGEQLDEGVVLSGSHLCLPAADLGHERAGRLVVACVRFASVLGSCRVFAAGAVLQTVNPGLAETTAEQEFLLATAYPDALVRTIRRPDNRTRPPRLQQERRSRIGQRDWHRLVREGGLI